MNLNAPTPARGAQRAALCLSLSLLMLGALAGCERRTTTSPDGSTTTTTTTPAAPPASAASR